MCTILKKVSDFQFIKKIEKKKMYRHYIKMHDDGDADGRHRTQQDQKVSNFNHINTHTVLSLRHTCGCCCPSESFLPPHVLSFVA